MSVLRFFTLLPDLCEEGLHVEVIDGGRSCISSRLRASRSNAVEAVVVTAAEADVVIAARSATPNGKSAWCRSAVFPRL